MNKKGFTLIELLVVITIISLFTTFIVVSIKDSRTKAKSRAMRTEVTEFVKAVELYRSNNNGLLPGPNYHTHWYRIGKVNGEIVRETSNSAFTLPMYEDAVKEYLPELPEPFIENSFFYYHAEPGIRCEGATSFPPYIVYVSGNIPGFEDLPLVVFPGGNSDGSRCYSL